jgi:hypothetical protein
MVMKFREEFDNHVPELAPKAVPSRDSRSHFF